MSDVDENTKNLDKLAEELSDYLNQANKTLPETKETAGCGKATVYEDLYDTIKVDPKTLNFELNFLDRSLDMYEINDSNEYLINTPVRNNYLYNFLPYNIYYPKDYNKDKNLNNTDFIPLLDEKINGYHEKISILFENIDIIEYVNKIIKEITDNKFNIHICIKNYKKYLNNNINNNINTKADYFKVAILYTLNALNREFNSNNIYYKNEHLLNINSLEYLKMLKDVNADLNEINHNLYVFNNYLIILKNIKTDLVKQGVKENEINIQLYYFLILCCQTTLKNYEFFPKFCHLVSNNRIILTRVPVNNNQNVINVIIDKLKNISDLFESSYFPENINKKTFDKEISIENLFNKTNDIYIYFDNNNNLMMTKYLLSQNILKHNNSEVYFGCGIHKFDSNLTKHTYNQIFKFVWFHDIIFNPDLTIIENIDVLIDIDESNLTSGGRRKHRKTVKGRKIKTQTKKRKRSKSRKIMRQRRLRPRNRP
jgi:hypothetical protein